MLIQFAAQTGDQFAALLIDWADTTKVVVMLGHFQHAFARNRLAAKNIFEERDDILSLLGAAEGKDKDRVILEIFRCHLIRFSIEQAEGIQQVRLKWLLIG